QEHHPKSADLAWTRVEVERQPQSRNLERYIRVALSKPRRFLWECGSIEGFKQAFLDCVESTQLYLFAAFGGLTSHEDHHHVWKEGRTLRRNLSDLDLMVNFVNSPKDPSRRVQGIIADWDIASKLGDDGNIIPSAALHQITTPFLSCDLLNERLAWSHCYRHELESLFYILLWAAVHYDLENQLHYRTAVNKGRVLPALTQWTDKYMRLHKLVLILNGTERHKIFSHIGPEFKTIETDWLEPLSELFRQAYREQLGWNPKLNPNYNHATCNGMVTFETFLAAMGATPCGFPGMAESIAL
ncbi:uncharacterized protein LACBIDRAFT_329860, partial [Laccaria bicolor S238N-H82]